MVTSVNNAVVNVWLDLGTKPLGYGLGLVAHLLLEKEGWVSEKHSGLVS